jgi:Ferric uptake regulator family
MITDPASLLRELGVHVTAQRLAVLRAVSSHPHRTAEEVGEHVRAEIGTISRQAVYDALGILADNGLIRRIQPAGSPARYECRVGDAIDRGHRGEAGGRVVAEPGEAAVDHDLDSVAFGGTNGPLLDEDLADRPVLLQDPGVHRRDQGVSGDEVVLKGVDAEQEVAIGLGSRHWDGSR